MTVEKCISLCHGYTYVGVEYGRECYCGNSFESGTTAPDSDCSFTCPGNAFEFCGAGDRLTVYSLQAAGSGTTASTSATATPTPTAKARVGRYRYVGCQTDDVNARVLNGPSAASDDMTLERCAAFCRGSRYWGTEYGRECWCGPALAPSSAVAPASDCSFACAGNAGELCGAGDRLNVYVLR
jgi:hypothetical protein